MHVDPGDDRIPFTIALIGPSGAGKTEVGRRLAGALGRPLVDTDALIVEREGRSIAEIFEQDSEDGFRQKESEAVAEAAATPDAVVACGGGAVLDPRNVEALKGSGVVVYLKVSPEVAAERVGSGNGRPLLTGGPVRRRLEKIIAEREAAYEAAADRTVDATGRPEDVVDALVGIWESVHRPDSELAQRWRLRR
ncbi:MAG: shikimate kinase [Actinomycetota bacterium]